MRNYVEDWLIPICVAIVALALIAWFAAMSLTAIRNDERARVARIHACASAPNVSDCLKLNGH